MNLYLSLLTFLFINGLAANKEHKAERSSSDHFEVLPISDQFGSNVGISTIDFSDSTNCTSLLQTCKANETCSDYYIYCLSESVASRTNDSSLNLKLNMYHLYNCMWRYRSNSSLVESYIDCVVQNMSMTVVYEYCFSYWDNCTNSTECFATFTNCTTESCYANNTIAESTYECELEYANSFRLELLVINLIIMLVVWVVFE